eukprot:TRINITY_DN86194_c0_g1_i1.p1 TRINITY_DN86194_c0_g1~~TRINITY_DN86194_c0_g1_i1.p1  ORF type:complete len:339 (+),score=40.79 TRINITY_DN86194_c0_g1_i1:52-1068(+)
MASQEEQDAEKLERNQQLLALIKKLNINDPEENWVGPYQLVRTLGQGATGVVKHAFLRSAPEEEVAIKIVDKSFLAANPDEKRRIEREIATLRKLDHPYIMKLYDVLEQPQHRSMILEFLPKGELYDYILKNDHIPVDEAFKFFFQLVVAVAHIHNKGIVHRDIKLENMIVDHKNDVKLADFGFAIEASRTIKLQECVGSIHYAAPEVVRGESYNGYQADIWSMGVVLFVLLSGRLPFAAESRELMEQKIIEANYKIPTEVPVSAQNLIKALLNPVPQDRLTLKEILASPWWQSRCSGRVVNPQMRKLLEAEFPPEDLTEGLHQRLLSPNMKLPQSQH